ncbi:HypC/HybG/HupF family hydrogenase formation chaperone [Slackia piriformis]|uniref:HypC/HybG/HupF family hydrogenase formation chaperone n=1 Tax=Slackia piriformis TaxID=626934 RepID=UPI002F9468D9
MCLAIPAKIVSIDENNLATVDILGVTRQASIDLTPQAQVGDYVLVHAGFAIEVVSEEHAQETLDLIREFPELADVETA